MEHLFGLLGFPLGHSFSPTYFKSKFEALNLPNFHYQLFECERLTSSFIHELLRIYPNLRGFNVTIPHKQTIIPLLDHISEEATAIGAVNTVLVHRTSLGNVNLFGFNTDLHGIQLSLNQLLLKEIPKNALILGSGGASKTVAHALQQRKINHQVITRRPGPGQLGWTDLTEERIKSSPLIINTTPLGMHPNIHQMPDIQIDAIGSDHFVFDLIYNPSPSKLLSLCSEKGARVLGGMTMLHAQADEAFKIWSDAL